MELFHQRMPPFLRFFTRRPFLAPHAIVASAFIGGFIDILDDDADRFFCTDEYWNDKKIALEFEVKSNGIVRKIGKASALAAPALGISATALQARPHGTGHGGK